MLHFKSRSVVSRAHAKVTEGRLKEGFGWYFLDKFCFDNDGSGQLTARACVLGMDALHSCGDRGLGLELCHAAVFYCAWDTLRSVHSQHGEEGLGRP